MQFHDFSALLFISAHSYFDAEKFQLFLQWQRALPWLSVSAVSIYGEHRISISYGRGVVETFQFWSLSYN